MRWIPCDGISVLLGRATRAPAHTWPRGDTARRRLCASQEESCHQSPTMLAPSLSASGTIGLAPSLFPLPGPPKTPCRSQMTAGSLGQGPEDWVDSVSPVSLCPLPKRTCGHGGVAWAGTTIRALEWGEGIKEVVNLLGAPPTCRPV